jgi:TonB family protein
MKESASGRLAKHCLPILVTSHLIVAAADVSSGVAVSQQALPQAGPIATVCGWVIDVVDNDPTGEPTSHIRIARAGAEEFRAQVAAQDRDSFGESLELLYGGGYVCVTGVIEEGNPPAMLLSGPHQVDRAFRMNEPGVSIPKVRERVLPEFPDQLMRRLQRDQEIEAYVLVEAIITREGKVADPRVREPGWHEEFNRRAMEAAPQWLFEPGTKDGRPVMVIGEFTFTYRARI